MEGHYSLVFVIILATSVALVRGYSGGAGDGACTSMIPGHGPAGQTSASPYSVSVSTTTMTAGSTIDVTISGAVFQGFLLQARRVGSDTSEGTWTNLPANTQTKCTGSRAVTHANPFKTTSTSSVTVTWQVPDPIPGGDVEFLASVVQEFSTFWVKIKSSAVQGDSSAPTASPAPTTTTTTISPAQQPDITIDLAECGTSKSCYRFPDGCTTSDCDFIVTWKNGDSGKVDFELSARSDGYAALGLSANQKMDDTSVTACVIQDSGVVMVSQFYNSGYASLPVTGSNQLGLSNTEATHKNDYVTCTFTRDTVISPTNSQVRDLDSKLYMIVAVGASAGGSILKHQTSPTVSSEAVNPTSPELKTIGGGAVVAVLEQVHAILMLTGWMLFAGIGIMMARYYKGTWSASKLCGEKVWFAVHRFLMISNFFLTIAAFIVIFIDAKRWSEFGIPYQDAHPIIGTIVTGLVIINPLMAACRPHPGDKNRPIFNWAHWGVGTAGYILAIVNIFLGMNLPSAKAFTPRAAMWILVAFVVVQAIIEIVLEVEKCNSRKKSGQADMEMKNINQGSGGDAADDESPMLKFIIGLYIFLAFAAWLAIVILMILPAKSNVR